MVAVAWVGLQRSEAPRVRTGRPATSLDQSVERRAVPLARPRGEPVVLPGALTRRLVRRPRAGLPTVQTVARCAPRPEGPEERPMPRAVRSGVQEEWVCALERTAEPGRAWRYAAHPPAESNVSQRDRPKAAFPQRDATSQRIRQTPTPCATTPPLGSLHHVASRSRPSNFARW